MTTFRRGWCNNKNCRTFQFRPMVVPHLCPRCHQAQFLEVEPSCPKSPLLQWASAAVPIYHLTSSNKKVAVLKVKIQASPKQRNFLPTCILLRRHSLSISRYDHVFFVCFQQLAVSSGQSNNLVHVHLVQLSIREVTIRTLGVQIRVLIRLLILGPSSS